MSRPAIRRRPIAPGKGSTVWPATSSQGGPVGHNASERCSVGMVLVYVLILPSVITALWALAWRGSQLLRWGALSGGAVISVLCVVIGITTNRPSVPPSPGACRPALACFDPDPVFWMAAGLLGFACCFVLMVVTVAVELWRIRRDSD